MKDIFRLPILFLFAFVLLFILFFSLNVLALWGSVFSEGREAALRAVEAELPRILLRVLPLAVLVALIVLLARIAVKPGNRFLSLVLPLAAAFLFFALGYQLLVSLDPSASGRSPASAAARPQPSARRYLVPDAFNVTESKVLYINSLDGRMIRPVVIVEGGSAEPKLLYKPSGRVAIREEAVVLDMAGYTLQMDPLPVYGPLFREPTGLRRLFDDLGVLRRELAAVFARRLPVFYFTVFALVLAVCGSGAFLRLTRWHLLNLALTLFALRGFLALFALLRTGVAGELEKVLSNPQPLQFLPQAVVLILGGLLVLVDLLFVPFRRWEEE